VTESIRRNEHNHITSGNYLVFCISNTTYAIAMNKLLQTMRMVGPFRFQNIRSETKPMIITKPDTNHLIRELLVADVGKIHASLLVDRILGLTMIEDEQLYLFQDLQNEIDNIYLKQYFLYEDQVVFVLDIANVFDFLMPAYSNN